MCRVFRVSGTAPCSDSRLGERPFFLVLLLVFKQRGPCDFFSGNLEKWRFQRTPRVNCNFLWAQFSAPGQTIHLLDACFCVYVACFVQIDCSNSIPRFTGLSRRHRLGLPQVSPISSKMLRSWTPFCALIARRGVRV